MAKPTSDTEQYVSPEEFRKMSAGKSPAGTKVTVPIMPIIGVVVAIVLVVAGFFAGDSYGKNHAPKTTTTASSATGTTNTGGFGGRAGGGGFRGGGFGTVTAVSASSITIDSTRTGTSTTYSITSSTTVTDNGSASTVSAIQTGDRVIIRPTTTGGTVAASIMDNPSFGGQGANGSAPTGTDPTGTSQN